MKYLLIILMASIFISCSSETIKSHWSDKGISVDGNNMEWQGTYLRVDSDLKLVYGVSNDARYLNVLIRFQDRDLARRMAIHGFTIWLDKDKKKRHTL